MHLAREAMLAAAAGSVPLAVLRPTLVYGSGDPHNGYGPNKFRRQANRGEPIVLFGEGEEQRDHVDVEDIAAIVRLVLTHRSAGILNIATGTVTSFRALAEATVTLSPRKVAINGSPRNGERYIRRIQAFANTLDIAAERGTDLGYIDPGLRAVPFESVMLAVRVTETKAIVTRVFHQSQNWLEDLKKAASANNPEA
jgi:nucleoside-diphosphate-sugar epimerase